MKKPSIRIFEVQIGNRLVQTGLKQPRTRRQAFRQVNLRHVHDVRALIEVIALCDPLVRHFRQLGQAHLARQMGAQFFVARLVISRRSGADQLVLGCLRRDPINGWKQWIKFSGDSGLEGFRQAVTDWLDQDLDCSERAHFNPPADGEIAAWRFFRYLARSDLSRLGIQVEDPQDLSTGTGFAYLVQDIDQANAEAKRMMLDCKFTQTKAHELEARAVMYG